MSKTAKEYAREACAMIGDIVKPKEEQGMVELFEQALNCGKEEYSGLAKHLYAVHLGLVKYAPGRFSHRLTVEGENDDL